MLEEVCKHPQSLATTTLQHAERIRKRNLQEGRQMKWPSFAEEEEEESTTYYDYAGSLGVGECAAVCEKSVTDQQAISIFRALDMDASGILTEASLIRGMSSWIASKGGDRGGGRERVGGAGEGGMEAGSPAIAGGEHLQEGSGGHTGLASVPEETAPSASDMAESEANVAASAYPPLPGKFQVVGADNAYAPGTPTAAAAAAAAACSTAAHAPPPHAPTASHAASAGLQLMEVRAIKVDGKMDRMLAKELAALRHEDLAVLQAKLRQVEHTHREATARISRVEQREGALCEHEAAVKRLEGQLQEQEAKLQERERAVKEQVAHAGVLRAEMTHKAQQLEDTARMLQQRKAAVEHRESLLKKQVCIYIHAHTCF
jgi:hypothetical protein